MIILKAIAFFVLGRFVIEVIFFIISFDLSLTNTMTVYEKWTLLVTSISSFGTILAVIVALFKEEIISLYKKANLAIGVEEELGFVEVIQEDTSESSNPSADRYELIIPIINKGKLPARGCEIELESFKIKNSDSLKFVDYNLNKHCFEWNDAQANSNIVIKSTSVRKFTIFTIKSPDAKLEVLDKAGDSSKDSYPIIRVGSSNIKPSTPSSQYQLECCILSDNGKPNRFVITIKLTHQWRPRLTEMNQYVEVTIKRS